MDTKEENGCVILKNKEYNELLKKVYEAKNNKSKIEVHIYGTYYHPRRDCTNMVLIEHLRPDVEFSFKSSITLGEQTRVQIRRIVNTVNDNYKRKLALYKEHLQTTFDNQIKSFSFWQLYKYWKTLKN